MRKIIIGVMGPGNNAAPEDLKNAYLLGEAIARQGWILLTGGRNVGVMDAASRGVKSADGLCLGILPTADTSSVSDAVDIAIVTDMGNARNNINVLTSDVIVACGMGAGTASEIALALKSNKKVVLLTEDEPSKIFFKNLSEDSIFIANSPEDVIEIVRGLVKSLKRAIAPS